MGIISKIKFLLKLRKENNDYYQYLKYRYKNKRMDKKRAKKIRENTFSFVNKGEWIINTYDFSDQVVHPDVIYFKNKYWVAVTPYPFGMDEYENPCLYFGDNLTSLEAYPLNPIALPSKKKIGYHLSDPCLYNSKDNLYLIYRESIRQKDHSEINILYKYDVDSNNEPQVICKSKEDYLSPAVLQIKDDAFLIYANKCTTGSQVYLCNLLDKTSNKQEIKCLGLPESYYVWHMGINFKDTLSKYSDENSSIVGILLLKSTKKLPFLVATCHAKDVFSDWQIDEILDNYDSLNIKHPYKCSLIPNTTKVAFSFRDVKDHYRICLLEKEELKK